MLSYFPKYYTDKAMYVYFALLVCVPVIFGYPMEWYFWIFGIVEVVGFFYFANKLPQKWAHYSPKTFIKELFITALVIRVAYVIFSYWFYDLMTGQPFEYFPGDVLFYDEMGRYGHKLLSNGDWELLDKFKSYANVSLSDSGYPIYMSLVYTLFDDSIITVRILKAVLSAWTCVLIYKLTYNNFGDEIGRLSSILCLLMPNLIYYCGIHLKETEMVFLIVFFAERVDFALRCEKIDWKSLLLAFLAASILFMVRTALAAVAVLSIPIAVILSSKKVLSIGKKIIISIIVIICMGTTIGSQFMNDAQELYAKSKTDYQEKNMEWRSNRENGNKFAKYAGVAVFAPMIFTIPFPTLIETPNQENQRMINGGNYVKNITSAFTIFALFALLFSGNWRKHILILSICCGYLVVISLSAFAHSERFHLPALPFSLILAALGISKLQNKHRKWFNYWIMFIFVANIAWAWFKLRGRGM